MNASYCCLSDCYTKIIWSLFAQRRSWSKQNSHFSSSCSYFECFPLQCLNSCDALWLLSIGVANYLRWTERELGLPLCYQEGFLWLRYYFLIDHRFGRVLLSESTLRLEVALQKSETAAILSLMSHTAVLGQYYTSEYCCPSLLSLRIRPKSILLYCYCFASTFLTGKSLGMLT